MELQAFSRKLGLGIINAFPYKSSVHRYKLLVADAKMRSHEYRDLGFRPHNKQNSLMSRG